MVCVKREREPARAAGDLSIPDLPVRRAPSQSRPLKIQLARTGFLSHGIDRRECSELSKWFQTKGLRTPFSTRGFHGCGSDVEALLRARMLLTAVCVSELNAEII